MSRRGRRVIKQKIVKQKENISAKNNLNQFNCGRNNYNDCFIVFIVCWGYDNSYRSLEGKKEFIGL